MNKKMQRMLSSMIAFVLIISTFMSNCVLADTAEINNVIGISDSIVSDGGLDLLSYEKLNNDYDLYGDNITESGKIWLAGDSTMSSHNDSTADYAIPRVGWGVSLGSYFKSDVTVYNKAVSGRSSKSFIANSSYTDIVNSIGAGDYLFIQFGHNDEKTEEDRYTDVAGDTSTEGSFKWYLKNKYIDVAVNAGAIPVLITPVVRYSNGIKGNAGSLELRANAMKELQSECVAQGMDVKLIDLQTKVIPLYTDATEATKLHAYKGVGSSASIDGTHYSAYGSKIIAGLVVEGMQELEMGICQYIKTSDISDGITVDGSLTASDEDNLQFKTVAEAVKYVTNNAPTKESERVYINIVPGVYREQVRINVPYVTIRQKEGTTGEVKLTWYYGIGYTYYSMGTDGYYDSNLAGGNTYTNTSPGRWGASFRVESKAVDFIAENIVFENSFNQYVTEEELLDGVKQTDLSKPDRNILQAGDEIVKTRDYRERAAAIAVEADRATFNNCSFLSKQDTLFTGNGREYYNNCIIEGTCDYIFGNATAVFDSCELRWAASPLSSDSDGGYICAPQSSSNLGYLFYNCKVTGNENAISGDFGRPWGGENSQATFYNTNIFKNSKGELLITDRGWTNMTSTADKAKFYEYGSIDENGNAVDTSKRVVNTVQPIGTVLNEWQILEFSPYNYLKGGDNWDPTGKNAMFESVEAGGKSLDLNSENAVEYNDTTGYYEVKDNFILPRASVDFQTNWAVFGSDGKLGSVWASIDGDNVKITKPAFGQDTEKVTLVLYIRNEDSNGVGAKVSFTLDIQTAEPASGEAAEALKQVIAGLNTDMESNYGDGNGGYIANSAMNLYTANSAYNGASYLWQSNNENVITSMGLVNRPNFTDDDAVVRLTCTVSIAGATDIVTYDVKVPKMKFGNWESFESAEIGDTATKSVQWSPSGSTDQSKITVGVVDNVENVKQENNGKIYRYYHEVAPGGSANSINFYFSGIAGDKSKAVDNTVGEFTYDIYLDKNSDKTEFYFTSATENTSPIINQHTKGSFKGNDGSTGVTFANNMDSDANGWYTVKYIMDATGDTMVEGKDKHELYYDLYVYDKDGNLIASRLNVLRNTAKSTTSDPCFVSIRPNRSSTYLDFYLDNLGYIDYTEAVAGDKADMEAMLATGMVTELPATGARDTDITWTVVSGDNIIAEDGTLTEGTATVKATVKRGYIEGGTHGVTDETAEYTVTVGKSQDDILTYKGAQLRYNDATDNYDIRFVSVISNNVDISSIEKVGFVFTKNGNTAPNDISAAQRIESTTVYDSISAVGSEVTAESLGGKYISGGIITGVPNTEDAKNTELYVYAYYVINGEYVYTPVQTVTVNGLL